MRSILHDNRKRMKERKKEQNGFNEKNFVGIWEKSSFDIRRRHFVR